MSVHSKAAVVIVITLGAIAGQARAQHVTGVVRDSASRTIRVVDEGGHPVRSASLIDDETGEVRATTNFAGEASLGWLPRGRTSVPVQRLGYEPTRVTVDVKPNDTTTVSVLMRRVP